MLRRRALIRRLPAAWRARCADVPAHADVVWQARNESERRGIGAVIAPVSLDGDPPAVSDPIAAHAPAARPDPVRAIWVWLPLTVQQSLGAIPALADLPIPQARTANRRGRCQGRA